MPKPMETIRKWSIRITPTDQLPILDWSVFEERPDTKVIIAQEGGTDAVQLHYHGYVEGLWSESKMRLVLALLGRSNDIKKGNAVYSVKIANEGTIGYVVKDGNICFRLNYDDTHIEEYMRQSEQYRKDLQASDKREVRKKQSFLQTAVMFVRQATQGTEVTCADVYEKIRGFYGERPMPSRNLLETAIIQCMGRDFQRQYYLKNLSNLGYNAN